MWRTKKLHEVCDIQSGLWKGKKEPFTTALVLRNTNFTAAGKFDYSDVVELEVETKQLTKREVIKNDIILEKSGGGDKTPVGRVCIHKAESKVPFSLSNFTARIRVLDTKELDAKFLHRFLYFLYISGKTEPMQRHSTGIRNLQLSQYKEIDVPLPPLAEQQRIVAKLDAAFAEIDTAVKSKVRALNNNMPLEAALSNLALEKFKINCEPKKISELFNLRSGDFLPKRKMNTSGSFNVYGGNGHSGVHDEQNLSGKQLIIGRVGQKCGNIRVLDEEFWLTDNAFYISQYHQEVDIDYLSLILTNLNLRQYARNGDLPVLSFSGIKDKEIPFHKDIKVQREIISQFKRVSADLELFSSIKNQQIKFYDSLKKSILISVLQSEAA